jgi:hypothetical protein
MRKGVWERTVLEWTSKVLVTVQSWMSMSTVRRGVKGVGRVRRGGDAAGGLGGLEVEEVFLLNEIR